MIEDSHLQTAVALVSEKEGIRGNPNLPLLTFRSVISLSAPDYETMTHETGCIRTKAI